MCKAGWPAVARCNAATSTTAATGTLCRVAGFTNVLDPMPLRNSRNAVVTYLFFASVKDTANRIVTDIFAMYRGRQG